MKPSNEKASIAQSKASSSGESTIEIGRMRTTRKKNVGRFFLMAKTAFVEKNTDLQIKDYKNGNPDFPDQTAADQFFDEKQRDA